MNIGIERIFSNDRQRFIVFEIDQTSDGVYRFHMMSGKGERGPVFESISLEQAEAMAAQACREIGL